MSKFKKDKGKESPAVSTASLPDIVFMLLFFFMVTTVLREVELKVTIETPSATEVEKLKNKALVSYIYIGEPNDVERFGTTPRIQLNDDFAKPKDVGPFIEEKRANVNEAEVPLLIASFKVDKETEMGIVTEVKQELRKVQQLKINYSTSKIIDKSKL